MARSPEPNPMPVYCPGCDGNVIGVPAGYVVNYQPQEGPPGRWTLLACPQHHPILVVQDDFGGQGFEEDAPVRVYPDPRRTLSAAIPLELRDAHEESRKTFTAKAYLATVVMCGRTLEGACALQGVKEKSLQNSLGKMKDQGIIDGRLWDWAQLLREVRNAGAHFDSTKSNVTRQDAEDCLTFNEALLDYLYVLKERFDTMRARRAPGGAS